MNDEDASEIFATPGPALAVDRERSATFGCARQVF